MDVPDWVWDEAHPLLSPSELQVVLAILRHGGGANREMHEGQWRARVTLTTKALASMAGVSARTIENGFTKGHLGRFIQQSHVTRRGASRSFSVYYQGQCAEFAHGSETRPAPVSPVVDRGSYRCAEIARQTGESSDRHAIFSHASNLNGARPRANGGGGEDLLIQIQTNPVLGEEDPTTTIPIAREKILRVLEAFEFAGANGFIRTHGPRRIIGALAEAWELIGIGALENPGAWLRSKVNDERRQFADPEGFEFFEALLAWSEDVIAHREEARRLAEIDARFRELLAEGVDREEAWERASAEYMAQEVGR